MATQNYRIQNRGAQSKGLVVPRDRNLLDVSSFQIRNGRFYSKKLLNGDSCEELVLKNIFDVKEFKYHYHFGGPYHDFHWHHGAFKSKGSFHLSPVIDGYDERRGVPVEVKYLAARRSRVFFSFEQRKILTKYHGIIYVIRYDGVINYGKKTQQYQYSLHRFYADRVF